MDRSEQLTSLCKGSDPGEDRKSMPASPSLRSGSPVNNRALARTLNNRLAKTFTPLHSIAQPAEGGALDALQKLFSDRYLLYLQLLTYLL